MNGWNCGSLSSAYRNPAYDFQWINFYFWRYFGMNPFKHSGRGIADFYAGLAGDFHKTQNWKRLRRAKHDHHPVHDALGSAEALIPLFDGEPLKSAERLGDEEGSIRKRV